MKGILRYLKGLHKDLSHMDQPPESVRFARNAVTKRTSGAYTSESGTEPRAALPVGARVVGQIPLEDERIVLFYKLGTRSVVAEYANGVIDTLLDLTILTSPDTDLNFQPSNPISGTYRLQGSGDMVVYFTDDLNPPRSINITRQKRSPSNRLYDVPPASSPDRKYIDRLNLFPHTGPVPHAELEGVYMGGGLDTAVYYLCLGYADADNILTPYSTVVGPVQIVDAPEGISPIESYDGSKPDILAGKLIKWNVSNLNTDYEYISVGIIIVKGGEQTAVKLNDVKITGSTTTVTFKNEAEGILASVDEFVIDPPSYATAKTMAQLDDTLYLGNLTGSLDLGYQCYANYIKVESKTHVFSPFDPMPISNDFLERKLDNGRDTSQGYRDPLNIDKYRGFTRNEVYSLYVAFILNDGRMSYAYHIPGREPLRGVLPSALTEDIREGGNTDPLPGTIDEDLLLYNYTNQNWELIFKGGQNQSYFYQWFDFSMVSGSRGMNYWHNLNEFYPDTTDFDVCDAQNPNVNLTALRGANVRHHRFPSNTNVAKSTIIAGDESVSEQLEELVFKSVAVVHWYWFGGIDNSPSTWTLNGRYPNENFEDARAFQAASYSPIGMGGEAPDNRNSFEATLEGPNSCLPSTHTELENIIRTRLSICNDAEELEFMYDTNILVGKEIVVAYDPPLDGQPNGEDHCSFIGTGIVGSVNGDEVIFGDTWWDSPGLYVLGNQEPENAWDARPGWVAWVECERRIVSDTKVNHAIQALGFCLSDLKIPRSIADKVQGFRIYYGKREHENRTVLGQSMMHPMAKRSDMDISGCDGNGRSLGRIDYWLATGQPRRTLSTGTEERFVHSFHDFYLLNNTPSLANATHMRIQYLVSMLNWSGSVAYYPFKQSTDTTDPTNKIYSCHKPQVITSFHAGGDYYYHTGNPMNYPLKNKGRAYVLGNTIYDGSQEGFQKAIYNVGGETHVAFRTERQLPYLLSPQDAAWRTLRSDNTEAAFVGYVDNVADEERKEGLQLFMANMQAFKTDVYSPMDTQDLVWTGYEVVGSDLDRFVVDDNGVPLSGAPNVFTTAEIYGGDTYICRHGYRMTHREEVNHDGEYPNTGSMDHKSVIYVISESTENINFRHMDSPIQVQSASLATIETQTNDRPYYPGASLKQMLKVDANIDLTYNPDLETGNIKYNENYSLVNDLKKVLPLPWRLIQPTNFPTTVIRSARTTATNVEDNFRYYSSDQVRPLNNHRGELWKLSNLSNLLLFHMESGLYRAKGKQTMQVSEGGEAYVGQGDLFEQTPDELVHTDAGYVGTRSQYANIVTPFGYFCVDNRNSRIFMVSQGVEDITAKKYGMEQWFRKNLPFALTQYGYIYTDQHTNNLGFHAVWDERYQRILLTKKDLVPTATFISNIVTNGVSLVPGIINVRDGRLQIYEEGRDEGDPEPRWVDLELEPGTYFTRADWTISFVPELSQESVGYWESFHDYVPYIYSHSGIDVHSLADNNEMLYRHNWDLNIGSFYGTVYPFEVEMIHNQPPGMNKLFSSLEYIVDVFDNNGGLFERKDLHAGFTSFLLYNTDACSGITPLEYMINIRKTEGRWKVNQFRDLSSEIANTDPYYIGPHTGGNFGIPNLNQSGSVTTSVTTHDNLDMFILNGMSETINPLYLDLNKDWYKQGKFVDLFLGVRLISDNSANKLINLYNSFTNFRPQER